MARKISRSSGRNRTASTQSRGASSQKAAVAAPARARSRDEELVENFFLGALLFFLAILVFYPAFHAGFIWDDDQLLTANPQVHSADGWRTLWLKPETADYFPLTSTTLWIEYHLGQYFDLWNIGFLQRHGMEGVWNGYHLMNILYHAISVVLTWQVLKRLRIPGAWLAAAIFAVHPVCVESVAWISERKNTISQIFFLLSIIQYVRFEERGRMWRFVTAVICFLLSLLAKTSVVMLPFILWLLAWWRYQELLPMRRTYELDENRSERGILLWSCVAAGVMVGGALAFLNPLAGAVAAVIGGGSGYVVGVQLSKVKMLWSFAGFELIRTLPFFLSAGLLGAVTVYFQYGRAIGGEEIPLGNFAQRIASACFATGFYLYSALWPFNIVEIYPQWHRAFTEIVTEPKLHIEPPAPESIPYWLQVVPGLIIGGLLYFCWTRRKETWARALLVGLGCYILAILPALGLLKMSYMRLTLVADHFQYISIIAVIALVVAAGKTRVLKPLWLIVAAVFFAIVSYVNWGQTQDNHIEELIWIAGMIALAVVPAQEDLWKWVWGGFVATVLVCFCFISWAQAGLYQSEETLWSATLEKNPNTWQGHNHLGAALYMRGDVKDAFPHFLKATQLKPENPESHNNLGLAESYFGMKEEAIHEYETAVGIKDDSAMDTNLANAYEEMKRYPDAIKTYKHALDLNPQNASAWCNMGFALMQMGRIDDAIPCFMRTMELDPTMPQGRSDLARALQMKGIDLANPVVTGSFSFDAQKALDMLRAAAAQPGMPPLQ
jgi:tetratricopeptide (TPR) repeat protein